MHKDLLSLFSTEACLEELTTWEGWLRVQAEELEVQLQSVIKMLCSSQELSQKLNSTAGNGSGQAAKTRDPANILCFDS